MIKFLEFTYDLDQISKFLKDIRNEEKGNDVKKIIAVGNKFNLIIKNIPPINLDKLNKDARINLSWILIELLNNNIEYWNELNLYLQNLWEQKINSSGLTLGKELVTMISSKVMDKVNAPFFISYSNNISKHTLYKYTKKSPKVISSTKNYNFNNYEKLLKSIYNDYTEMFNNIREKYKQIK